ncbi:hypothetical protein ACM66B_005015 [Microbotryomycetes sp. NB124-2]
MSRSVLVPNTPSQRSLAPGGEGDLDDSYGDSYLQDMMGGKDSMHVGTQGRGATRERTQDDSAPRRALEQDDSAQADETTMQNAQIDTSANIGPAGTAKSRILNGSLGQTQLQASTAELAPGMVSQPQHASATTNDEATAAQPAAERCQSAQDEQAPPAPPPVEAALVAKSDQQQGEAHKENSPPEAEPAPPSSLASHFRSEGISSSPMVAQNLLRRGGSPIKDADSAPVEYEKVLMGTQGPTSDPVPATGMSRHVNRLGPQTSTPAFSVRHMPPIQPARTVQQLSRAEHPDSQEATSTTTISPTKRKATHQSSDVMSHAAVKPKKKRRNSWGDSSSSQKSAREVNGDAEDLDDDQSFQEQKSAQELADESGEVEMQRMQLVEAGEPDIEVDEEDTQQLMVDRMPEPMTEDRTVLSEPVQPIPESSLPPMTVVPASDAVTEQSLASQPQDPTPPFGPSVAASQTQPSQTSDSGRVHFNLTDIGMMGSSQAYASQFEVDPTQIVHDVERDFSASTINERNRDLPEFQFETVDSALSKSASSADVILRRTAVDTSLAATGQTLNEPEPTVLESQPPSSRFAAPTRLEAIEEVPTSAPPASMGTSSGGIVPDSQVPPQSPRKAFPASSVQPPETAGPSSSASTAAPAQTNPMHAHMAKSPARANSDSKGKQKAKVVPESESIDELDLISGANRREGTPAAQGEEEAAEGKNDDVVEEPQIAEVSSRTSRRASRARGTPNPKSTKPSKDRKALDKKPKTKRSFEVTVKTLPSKASVKKTSRAKASSSKATSVASETESGEEDDEEVARAKSCKTGSSKCARTSAARSRVSSVSDEGSLKPGAKSKLPAEAPFSRVMALWRDDGWMYPATIVSTSGGFARVRFEDGAVGKLRFTELRRCELRCGDLIHRTQDSEPTASTDFKVVRCEKAGTGECTSGTLESDDEIVARPVESALDEQDDDLARIKIMDICIRPAHVVLLDDRRITPREIAAFEGRAGPSVAKKLPLLDIPPAPEVDAAPINKRSGLFARTAFLMTNVVEDRQAIQASLADRGGSVVDVEHFMRATVSRKGQDVQVAFAQQAFKDVDTILLLADRPSTTPKYLIALALGIPCVCSKYILESVRENVRLDWRDFAMSSGTVQSLGTWVVGAQMRSINKSAFDLASLAVFRQNYGLFRGRSVLVVKSSKLAGEMRSVLTIIAAAGATKVDFVAKPEAASDATAYDNVILDDGQSKPSSLATHPGVGSLTWLKQCLIAGRVLPPALLKPTPN